MEYHFTIHVDHFNAHIIMRGEWTVFDLKQTIFKALGFEPFTRSLLNTDPDRAPDPKSRYFFLYKSVHWESETSRNSRLHPLSSICTLGKSMLLQIDDGFESLDEGWGWHVEVQCVGIVTTVGQARRRSRVISDKQGTPPSQFAELEKAVAAHCVELCAEWGEDQIRYLLRYIVAISDLTDNEDLLETCNVETDPLTKIIRPFEHFGFFLEFTSNEDSEGTYELRYGRSCPSMRCGSGGRMTLRKNPDGELVILRSDGMWVS